MLKTLHQGIKLLCVPRLPSKLPQPFPKRSVESSVLTFCGKPSLFDEIFIGAEGDVLHTKIVYTRVVYARKHFAFRFADKASGRQCSGRLDRNGLTNDHRIITAVVVTERRGMKRMAASSFKSKCLAVMDEVHAKCETVIITKHAKPVAKLVPVNAEKHEIYDFRRR